MKIDFRMQSAHFSDSLSAKKIKDSSVGKPAENHSNLEIKWQPIVKIKTSVLFEWYIMEGNKKKNFNKSLGIKTSLLNNKIVSDEIFIDLNEWERFESFLASQVESNKNFLNKVAENCYRCSQKLLATSHQLGSKKDWFNLTSRQLLSLYKKYQESVLAIAPFMHSILALDDILQKEIVKTIEGKLGVKNKSEQDLLLSKLIIPKKKSFFVQETEGLLKMALKLQKNKRADLEKDIQSHLRKFAWTSSGAYLGSFQTKKEVLKKIKILLKENPKEKLEQAKEANKELQENYKKAFEQIKTDKELVNLIELASECLHLKTYRMDICFKAHYFAYPLLEAIAKRFKLSVGELVYLTGYEIVDLLKENAKPNKREIKNRMSDYAIIETNGKYTLLSGKQVKKVSEKVLKEISVTGTIANKGRANGVVKLIFKIDDILKVKRGDIIVSPMTYPQLFGAIVKAAGIITDFGGMLCHAAIVSREFGIPCIVDTKNATKVFKDGDLVELNAYDGIARKLQSQKNKS